MSWAALEVRPPQEQGAEDELKREVMRVLDKAPLFARWMKTTVKGACYQPGASLDQVAHREGQRALARKILQLGEMYDE